MTWSQRGSADQPAFDVGEDECGAGKVGDSSGAHGDVAEGFPAFDEQSEAAFAEAAQPGEVRGCPKNRVPTSAANGPRR